jgi:hypothetical protein
MTDHTIISPNAPARQSDDQDWRRYVRKAAGILRSASSSHGSFTVTGKLALLLGEQRTPRNKDHSWDASALRDNIARALAEIEGLTWRAEHGEEAPRNASGNCGSRVATCGG